ncbi:MAG: TolC family protein [Planctomycetes bacterium]|nr:TolC family protein [Planctomycetota bacterium]
MRNAALLSSLVFASCVAYEAYPLAPRDELARLVERSELEVHGTPAGPWSRQWLPLAAEVHLDDGVTVDEAATLALCFAPAVLAARAEAQVTDALVLQAGLLHNPQLFIGPRISARDSTLIFPAGLGWNLPIWGQESSERGTAEARADERHAEAITVELETLQRVRLLFFRLERLQRQASALDRANEASARTVRWLEQLGEVGESDGVAAFLARSEHDTLTALVQQAHNQHRTVKRELLELCGMLPNAPVEFDTAGATASFPDLPAPDRARLLAVPALRAEQARYETAEADLRHQVNLQFPVLQFGPQFEDTDGDPYFGLGLQFNLPIFDRNRGNIDAAKRARDLSRARYRATLLRCAHDEAEARDQLATSEQLLQVLRGGALRDAEQARAALAARLRSGHAQALDVVTTQRAIVQAEVRALELEEQIAAARLMAAVAGGFATEATAPQDKETDR